jgi:hypothetical protein
VSASGARGPRSSRFVVRPTIPTVLSIRTLPDTPTRVQRELDMQLTLGRALAVANGFAAPETGHAYARARELCHQAENPRRFFAVLVGLREFYLNRGGSTPHGSWRRHVSPSPSARGITRPFAFYTGLMSVIAVLAHPLTLVLLVAGVACQSITRTIGSSANGWYPWS